MSTHYQRGVNGQVDTSETGRQLQDYQQGQRERARAERESKRAWDQLVQSQPTFGDAAGRSRGRATAARGASPPMTLADCVRTGLLFGALGLAGYQWLGAMVQSWPQLAWVAVLGGAAGAVAGGVLYVVVRLLKVVLTVVSVVLAWTVGAVLLVVLLKVLGFVP